MLKIYEMIKADTSQNIYIENVEKHFNIRKSSKREVTLCILELEHALFQGSFISKTYSVIQRFYTGKTFLISQN